MSKSVNGGSAVSYTIDTDSHHLEAVGASPRTYDANGNTTAMTGHTLSYNDRNRLSGIDLGADDVSYLHNARGERVRKLLDPGSGPDETTTYAFSESGQLLMEKHVITGGATTTTEIIWLDNLPIGLLRNNVLYYIEPDHLGTPRQVVHPGDNEAIWHWALVNDPFGEGAADTDPDSDSAHFTLNLRFPGQLHDAETGLHYNYFRDYESATGKYIESDPIGFGGGPSTYAYAQSNSLRFVDSLGLYCKTTVECACEKDPKNCVFPPPPSPKKPDMGAAAAAAAAAAATTTTSQTEDCPTCAKAYPTYDLCMEISMYYPYLSESAVMSEFPPGAHGVSATADKGMCANKGIHKRVRLGKHNYLGSIYSCTCCSMIGNKPMLVERWGTNVYQ